MERRFIVGFCVAVAVAAMLFGLALVASNQAAMTVSAQ
jgi:hypothetical protein